MKDHFETERDARDAVAGYIRAWELDATLVHGPNAFRLRFDRSDIEYKHPNPDAKHERGGPIAGRGTPTCAVGTLAVAQGTVFPPTYPKPPSTGLQRSPDVERMLDRYVGYREGKEPLTSMAYFCLTTLQGKDGRAGAAARYCISKQILRRLSNAQFDQRRFRCQKSGRRSPRPDPAGKTVPRSGRQDYDSQGGKGSLRSRRPSHKNHDARSSAGIGEGLPSEVASLWRARKLSCGH